jgi:hypothetical protein
MLSTNMGLELGLSDVNVKVVTLVKDDLLGLKRTEQSVRRQSKEVSWILVTPQDNSNTFDYTQSLKEQGIVSEVILDAGKGVYFAMNQALNNSKQGDWVWFLNAGDEFAMNSSYEIVWNYAHTTQNKWIYGGHFLGSHNFKVIGEIKTPKRFKPSNQLFSKKYISHQSVIFNAIFLQELGGFDDDYKIAADWDLLVRASNVDPGLRIPETLSIFYMGGLSTRARQTGNKELLRLREIHLGPRYWVKNYYWFCFRWVRNKIVLEIESNFPLISDSIRKIRLKFKYK